MLIIIKVGLTFMKQILQFLTIVLVFTAACFAQSKPNSAITKQIKDFNGEKDFALEYFENGNSTKLMFFGEDFGRSQTESAGIKSLTFGMMFFYPGKSLDTEPAAVNLTFWVETKKPKFAQSNNFSVFTAGETIDLGKARYAVKQRENREFLNFVISFETLKKIAQNANGNLKIGDYNFKFTPEHLKRLSEFVKLASL